MILIWAYSHFHQHLYTSVNNRRIFEAFGYRHNKETKKLEKKNRGEIEEFNLNNCKKRDFWAKLINKLPDNTGKINYVMGNLAVKELFKVTEGGDSKSTPERIRVTAKGLLLGELLYEGYCSENFWKKDFRLYRWGYRLLQIIIVITIATIILVFLNQLWEFKGNFSNKTPQ